eukprot:gnl/TRDRNA2_/TRDRNA2_133102_c0_seq1.p1 gnl/TRDRNA2_/TRDRNA2_133102_c0~~gnl/TRDRNA2_/TRDRNA2_133102_c0_seq1.p1  ORF type:complete len:233 (-),score=45.65 gnl/TRDRNA2_/TRDRNA2_133102_c0_seq1:225-923(-)
MFAVCASRTCCVCDEQSSGKPVTTSLTTESQVTLANGGDTLLARKLDGATRMQDSARSTSFSSMSPEEKTQEKQRLQELVKQFARDSLRGVECTLIDPVAARKHKGQYRLDGTLNYMHFARLSAEVAGQDCLDRQDGSGSSVIPIAAIGEISAFSDMLESEQKTIREFLQQDECRNVLLIKASSSGQVPLPADSGPVVNKAYVLLPDAAENDRFTTCMKILRLYCQTSALGS